MNDFVAEHGGQLSFVLQLGQQTGVDSDLAARQSPGIGHRVVQHHEFVRQLAIRHGRKLLAHFVHIGREFRQHVEVAALALLSRRVLLLADLDLLRLGDELNLFLARDRIDAAATERERGDQ